LHCDVFFYQSASCIRDFHVTGVQTCALPICPPAASARWPRSAPRTAPARPTPSRRASWCAPGPSRDGPSRDGGSFRDPRGVGQGVTEVPRWLDQLAANAAHAQVPPGLRPPARGGREAAVLALFGEGPHGPDVLLIQRSARGRRHAGQPAFPGGGVDPGDGGPVGAALREAEE